MRLRSWLSGAGMLPFLCGLAAAQPFLQYDFSTDDLSDFLNPTVVDFCSAQGGPFGCGGIGTVEGDELLITNSDFCDKGADVFAGITIMTLSPDTVKTKFPGNTRDYRVDLRVRLDLVNELVLYLRGRGIYTTYAPTGELQVNSFFERAYQFAFFPEFTDPDSAYLDGALVIAESTLCHTRVDHNEWPNSTGPGFAGTGFAKADPGFPIGAGAWHRIQIASHGNDNGGPVVLSAKIWPDGAAEPEIPQLVVTDPNGLAHVPLTLNPDNDYELLIGTSFDLAQQPGATLQLDDLALTQLTGCPQAPVTATRKLWDSKAFVEGVAAVTYEAGIDYPVSLTLSNPRAAGGCGAAAAAARIIEVVPRDWRISGVSHSGTIQDNTITWTADLTGALPQLAYTVTPVPGRRVSFSGIVVETGSEFLNAVAGETSAVGEEAIPEVGDFGTIQRWLILGPFNRQVTGAAPGDAEIARDYLTNASGSVTEATILPKAGDQTVPDYGRAAASINLAANTLGRNPGNTPTWLEWIDLDDDNDRIDFEPIYGALNNILCYAVAYLNVETEIAVNFGVSSDDSVQILLDGRELHHSNLGRSALVRAYQDTPVNFPNLGNVLLTRGQHILMVKVFEGGGDHNFRVGFVDEFGLEIPGGIDEVRISLVPEARPGAPSGPTAGAGDKSVSLSWTAPASGAAPAGYNVYQVRPEPGKRINNAPIAGTQFVHEGLQNGENYCYTVRAALASGSEGPESTQVCATPKATGVLFRRGDVDASGAIDISDPINNLGYQFLGIFTPPCFDAADDDDSGTLDISDPIFSLTRQFLGGPIWPAPHPDCGLDATPDAVPSGELGCATSTCQ